MTKQGMKTHGHLWRVDRHIKLDREPGRVHFDQDHGKRFFKPFERARLRQLASSLEQTHPELSSYIHAYLAEVTNLTYPYHQRAHIMRIMARRICQAMKRGQRLLIGASTDLGAYRAVFVCPRPSICQPLHILTSWETGQHIKHTSSMQTVEKYMSIEVEWCQEGTSGADCCIPKQWVHGLCFFRGMTQQEIVFPWPDGWGIVPS